MSIDTKNINPDDHPLIKGKTGMPRRFLAYLLKETGDPDMNNWNGYRTDEHFSQHNPNRPVPNPLPWKRVDEQEYDGSTWNHQCICGHGINEVCYIAHKTDPFAFAVGNCCVNKVGPKGMLNKKCVTCKQPYKYPKYDDCKACRDVKRKQQKHELALQIASEEERKRIAPITLVLKKTHKRPCPNCKTLYDTFATGCSDACQIAILRKNTIKAGLAYVCQLAKHHGETTEQVMKEDPSYCAFILREPPRSDNMQGFQQALRWAEFGTDVPKGWGSVSLPASPIILALPTLPDIPVLPGIQAKSPPGKMVLPKVRKMGIPMLPVPQEAT